MWYRSYRTAFFTSTRRRRGQVATEPSYHRRATDSETASFGSGSSGLFLFSLHHHDEEDSALVPAAEPGDPPIIDTIAQGHRLAKPNDIRPSGELDTS